MTKQLMSLFCLIFLSATLFSQSKYSRVKIDLSKTNLEQISRLGLETDHGSLIPGVHFVNDFSEKEIALLVQEGIEHYIVVEDVVADYKARKNSSQARSSHCEEESYDYETPENYTYGSMGGYHTYDEMLLVLEEMQVKYPSLITPIKVVEGHQTWEGNEIVWLRISDNPNMDEDEPEVLYTALHHAREPNSLSQMLFYMWYLLENYEEDALVKNLVDNTEMYFMPCLNPDGYKYNELIEPTGGGLWRKNRRPDLNPEKIGVDLNRNYGFFWGFDDTGSSPDMESIVYRGPQAFSEPETQAVRAFCLEHDFQIAMNYHTHGNLLIHPWGYNDQPTEEDSIFKTMAVSMTNENNFRYGTGTETVGYVVNGNSDDYMYGEDAEKNPIYSFTPEVGPRFWPQQNEIDELNKSCVRQNLNTANLVMNFYDLYVGNLEPIFSENSGTFDLEVVKAGLKEGDATVNLVSNDADFLSFTEFVFPLSLSHTDRIVVPVEFEISESAPSLMDLSFDVIVDNGEFEHKQTYSFTYRNTIFESEMIDDFTDLSNWSVEESPWGLTPEHFVSAPNSLTDSPDGDYENFREDYVTLIDQLSLEESDFTLLKFSARWQIEFNYDYAILQVSSDNGENWTSLCGNYTRPGVQSHGTTDPLYDGIQDEWVIEEIDLSEYQGQVINLRLGFVSDAAVELDGFYMDDILIEYNTLIDVCTEDVLTSDVFEVMPSLNNGTFDVEIKSDVDDGVFLVEVLSMDGKIVERIEDASGKVTIDLRNAGSGVYVVRLVDKDGRIGSRRVSVIRD